MKAFICIGCSCLSTVDGLTTFISETLGTRLCFIFIFFLLIIT